MRYFFIILLYIFSLNLYAAEAEKPTFSMTTNAFLDKVSLPVLYTCDGSNVSPQLEWSVIPPKTQSFVLILIDKDAPNGIFYHWILFNIPKNITKLEQGVSKLPAGAMLGKNSFGKVSYDGPCPPKGGSHTYVFTLYALDKKLDLKTGADATAILAAIKGHEVGKTEISTVYTRWLH